MEEDLEWARQQSVPASTRLAAQSSPGRGAGRGGADPDSIAGTGGREWARQHSTPAERPGICVTPRGTAGCGVVAQWYYKDWAGEHGPRTLLQLTQALQKGYFTPLLLVRKEGTEKWHSLRDVLDLRQALRARRVAAWKEEQEKKGGSPGGRQQQQHGERRGAGATGAAASSPSYAAVNEGLISQLFSPGGPDWYYIDMQGAVQGPFSSARMAKWWSNPQYRDHFATLNCRRGTTGPFQRLSDFTPQLEQEPASASPSRGTQPSSTSSRQSPANKALAAEELIRQLKARVQELEGENEQLRQSNEDTFMLRMQVEQLYADKAALAKEVAQLKRDKAGLEELLTYAQQFEGEEGLFEGVDSEAVAGGEEYGMGLGLGFGQDGAPSPASPEDDEATQRWLEELKAKQDADPSTSSASAPTAAAPIPQS